MLTIGDGGNLQPTAGKSAGKSQSFLLFLSFFFFFFFLGFEESRLLEPERTAAEGFPGEFLRGLFLRWRLAHSFSSEVTWSPCSNLHSSPLLHFVPP